MTAATCLCGCGRPLTDGYLTSRCAERVGEQLRQIADMVPAARDVAHGLSRRGGGSATGKPGSRLPLDLGATERLDAVERELGTWLRHVAEERGSATTVLVPLGDEDPIVVIAERLMQHLEWWRHRPEVDEFLTDVDACARVVAGIARGPAAQRYLGPCGAELASIAAYGPHPEQFVVCNGDIYAREGASVGRCRTCGAEVASQDRRAWLDAQARSHAFRAAQLADAYGINDKTIRSWAFRGHLKSYWRTEAGLTVEWADPVIEPDLEGDALAEREAEVAAEIKARGPRLHYVGDVLDLAAADAARREEGRARRARRKEQAA
jgi:hypothetical protein